MSKPASTLCMAQLRVANSWKKVQSHSQQIKAAQQIKAQNKVQVKFNYNIYSSKSIVNPDLMHFSWNVTKNLW